MPRPKCWTRRSERRARGGGEQRGTQPGYTDRPPPWALAERRDPWRGHGRLPRPAGKGFDSGRGRRAEAGPGRGRRRPRRTSSLGQPGPDPVKERWSRAHRWTRPPGRPSSHPASLERPGPPLWEDGAGNRGGSRRLGRGGPGERATLTPFSSRFSLSPPPFILGFPKLGKAWGWGWEEPRLKKR